VKPRHHRWSPNDEGRSDVVLQSAISPLASKGVLCHRETRLLPLKSLEMASRSYRRTVDYSPFDDCWKILTKEVVTRRLMPSMTR
jgi:hypothetical protein